MLEPPLEARLKENTTSSAVNGVPSENFTLSRRVNSHTVGDFSFQAVAKAGCSFRSPPRRRTGSYSFCMTDSKKVSLRAYGSIELTSPSLAHLKTLPCAKLGELIIVVSASVPAASMSDFTPSLIGCSPLVCIPGSPIGTIPPDEYSQSPAFDAGSLRYKSGRTLGESIADRKLKG